MPHRNVIRRFEPNRLYHVYNRGVEKRQIFMDIVDYGVFLNRLKQMLIDPDLLDKGNSMEHLKSFYGDIELVAYCLMPNHFHLLLYQQTETAIAEFMRTLSTSYTMYFNKRYDRVGSLFQGRYKARLIDDDAYYQHISRYIHLNPLSPQTDIESFPYSSMQFYKTPEKCPSWVIPTKGMAGFETYEAYRRFVMSFANPEAFEEINRTLTIE